MWIRSGLNLNILLTGCNALLSYVVLSAISRLLDSASELDAYFLFISISLLLVAVFNSFFGAVMLPILVARQEEKSSHSIIISVTFFILVIGGLLATIVCYFNSVGLLRAFTAFDDLAIASMENAFSYLGVYLFLSILGDFLRYLLLSEGRYSHFAFLNLFQASILFLYLYTTWLHVNMLSLVYVITLSKFITVIMGFLYIRRHHFFSRFVIRDLNGVVRLYTSSGSVYLISDIITSLCAYGVTYLASTQGPGSVSVVSLTQRIFSLPFLLVAQPIMDVYRHKFSKSFGIGDFLSLQIQFFQLFRFLVVFGFLCVGGLYFGAGLFVDFVFDTQAFDNENRETFEAMLRLFAFLFPVSFYILLVGRLFESVRCLTVPSLWGVVGNVLQLLILYFIIDIVGLLTVPMVKGFVEIFYFVIVLSLLMKKYCPFRANFNSMVWFLFKVMFVSCLSAVLVGLVSYFASIYFLDVNLNIFHALKTVLYVLIFGVFVVSINLLPVFSFSSRSSN